MHVLVLTLDESARIVGSLNKSKTWINNVKNAAKSCGARNSDPPPPCEGGRRNPPSCNELRLIQRYWDLDRGRQMRSLGLYSEPLRQPHRLGTPVRSRIPTTGVASRCSVTALLKDRLDRICTLTGSLPRSTIQVKDRADLLDSRIFLFYLPGTPEHVRGWRVTTDPVRLSRHRPLPGARPVLEGNEPRVVAARSNGLDPESPRFRSREKNTTTRKRARNTVILGVAPETCPPASKTLNPSQRLSGMLPKKLQRVTPNKQSSMRWVASGHPAECRIQLY